MLRIKSFTKGMRERQICILQYTGCFRRNSKYFRRWSYGLFRV